MKQKFILFLDIAGFIGILMIISGGIMTEMLPSGKETVFAVMISAGIAMLAISIVVTGLMTDSAYVCPECKARFDIPKGEFTLTSYIRGEAVLLTCPKCKKTNLCRRKRILKSNNK